MCLECIVGGALATEASFQIENNQVAPSEGTVVNGTLVVFDSETTFSEENTIASRQAFVEHGSKSQHYQYWMNDSCILSVKVLRMPDGAATHTSYNSILFTEGSLRDKENG